MQNSYKYVVMSIILCLWIAIGWAQTPQLNFTLTSNESGFTKSYIAREYIILGNGFRYRATPSQSFIARIDKTIDITLPNGTVVAPDGTQIKPDGTIVALDGTQTKLDGTIITPEGTIYKIDGTIINPNGTLLNVSVLSPEVWFKTKPVTTDINGRYKWKDFSPNYVPLVKYATNGTSTEYTVARDSVMYYNFNPAIDLSAGSVSKEILIEKNNLAQATIIGIWGSKQDTTNTNEYIFALNGRQNESVVFSKSNVYPSIESGKSTLAYGDEMTKNLIYGADNTITARKARESSLRIASYYKSDMPDMTLWGEEQKANISLGSVFHNANNTSTFDSLNIESGKFEGFSPELLVFGKILQPAERRVFESYLAIKYGVSMDKSYLSGSGEVIWDYKSNIDYNNRITAYGREDILGLNQKMATTSYQEAPYYSDSCDSYQANSANTLSAHNRLLVMGCQTETPLNDGEYVLFGDDDSPITATNTSVTDYIAMSRTWLVNINSNRAIKNWVELSYLDSLASEFASHKNETYLMIDRTGEGNFNSSSEVHLVNSLDVTRSKIIFKDIVWNTTSNPNTKVAFTFAYINPNAQQLVKKNKDTDSEESSMFGDLKIYYTEPNNMRLVTVKVQTAELSPVTITLCDITGRKVESRVLPESRNIQYSELKLPEKGIYIINVKSNFKQYSQKVISN